MCVSCVCYSQDRLHVVSGSAEHGSNELHKQTIDRTRERIPLQQVPDSRAAHRDRRGAGTQRDAGENLVSKSPHETEETDEGLEFRCQRAANEQ